MARSSILALIAVSLVFAGCHGGTSDDGGLGDGGTLGDGGRFVVPVDDLDAGNGLRQPLADTLGPFSGEFDVNGAGDLFAIQVDGHLAVIVNDPGQSFLGTIDAGHFKTEIAYRELETCAPITFDGSYLADGGYSGTQTFCTAGEPASGPLVGQRFIGAQTYRQDLAWSGAYDATETADPSNTCNRVSGSHKLVFGVARDLDGGAVTAALFGDGLNEQLVFGGVDATSGLLSAHAVDSAGNATDSFRLFFLVDGGVGGTREAEVDTDAGSCVAELQFWGAKR